MTPVRRAVVVWLFLAVMFLLVYFAYKPVVRTTFRVHKFNGNIGWFIATTAYSHYDEDTESSEVLSNSSFPSELDRLDSEDTQYVSALRNTQVCVPTNFGYSPTAGNAIFPPYQYPLCSSYVTEKPPQITLGLSTGNFSMECPRLMRKSYVKNPKGLLPEGHYLYTDLAEKWKVQKGGEGEMDLGDSEFVYGSCGSEFTEAVHLPRFNKSVYVRVKEVMEQRGHTGKPLSVILLTIDSFSRKHFYRKLNETVKLLNAIKEEGKYSVFDFKLNNVMGGNSMDNMGPIFGNVTLKPLDNPPNKDRLESSSLWHIFRENGYATMLGFENCDYRFPASLGRRLQVDHLVRNFYCAYSKIYKRTMEKDQTEQRCIGPRMSHYYVLNYTLAFMKTYQGLNQFISLHIDTAHEATGQHAVTLDPDLTVFLRAYLAWGEERGQDVVIFLQGDHGMRYGRWFRDVEASQELKLPAFFILAPKTFLKRIPGSEGHLWTNTFRLTSKIDLRAAILGLTLLPYGANYPVHGDVYLNNAIDLFREDSPANRTCDTASIPPWYCSCMLFEQIDMSAIIPSSGSLSDLVYEVAHQSLRIINRETATSPNLPQGLLCEKLELDMLGKANGLNLGRSLELIKVEFYVKSHKTVKFEALAIVGAELSADLLRLEWERYELLPYLYNGFQVRIRILGIERKDTYAGECETVARINNVRAEFCVCKDLQVLKAHSPGLWATSSE
jgi:hypothetical protein